MELTVDQDAKEKFEFIQEAIQDALILENEGKATVTVESILNIHEAYVSAFKEIAVINCYDFCISPKSRIMVCLGIIAAVSTSIRLEKQIKLMFLYNVVLNSNWAKVQEFAIQNLKVLRGTEELNKLKEKLTEKNLIDIIDAPLPIKYKSFSLLQLFKKLFR